MLGLLVTGRLLNTFADGFQGHATLQQLGERAFINTISRKSLPQSRARTNQSPYTSIEVPLKVGTIAAA
jgi:hypothetical protein